MQLPFTDYYLMLLNGTETGEIRVVCRSDDVCRVSPIFVLPKVQGRGYTQQAMLQAENLYPHRTVRQQDTILQEEKLCYPYEKLGYRKTGETETIRPGKDIVFCKKSI